jgi:hypothetical protein
MIPAPIHGPRDIAATSPAASSTRPASRQRVGGIDLRR